MAQKILIYGAGSVGVYLGCKLSAKGHEVTLLGRSKLRELNDVINIGETSHHLPARIYELPASVNFDYVFITSKLYDLEANLQALQEHGVSGKVNSSIQNGIVEETIYKPYIGKALFCPVSLYEGYNLVANQLRVSPSEIGWKTDVSLAGVSVEALLVSALIPCTTDHAFDSIRAEKTVMNCAVNALSAVEKKTLYELFLSQHTNKTIDRLFDESYDVLSQSFHLRRKEELRERLRNTLGPMNHHSSTYQDAIKGHKTEIDFMNGLIVRLGKKHKIETPENEAMIERFRAMYG